MSAPRRSDGPSNGWMRNMADRLDIVNELESLAVHCRLPLMDIDARSRWMQTWCEDLAQFPLDAIKAACRAWRQGEDAKFPTPGKLLPLVRYSLPKPARTDVAERPWTWPSEADLATMTLRERRRQYLIMAGETRSKVGPMKADGTFPQPEFLAQAQAYRDHASDLAAQISRSAQHHDNSAA